MKHLPLMVIMGLFALALGTAAGCVFEKTSDSFISNTNKTPRHIFDIDSPTR